mmetsp:Transcript_2806/g.4061  ORF Transcript_2806/g.4061 Transcript_2806/m.4061 type:complete len:416 (-) Transcript_2806:229-1476(-)
MFSSLLRRRPKLEKEDGVQLHNANSVSLGEGDDDYSITTVNDKKHATATVAGQHEHGYGYEFRSKQSMRREKPALQTLKRNRQRKKSYCCALVLLLMVIILMVIFWKKYYNGTTKYDDQQQVIVQNEDNHLDCDGCRAEEGAGICGKVAGDQYIIPRRLIFTYEENILETKEPSYLYNNIQNTIQMYSRFWNQNMSEVDVCFLDDNKCLKVIEQVEPRLVQPFQSENIGPYKADICRIAALYLCGGYYFDVDIQALEPLKPEPHIDFITAIDPHKKGFFQAVLATSPSHPVLKLTFDSMINDWYFNPVMAKHNMTGNTSTFDPDIFYSEDAKKILHKNVGHDLMGPITIYRAYFRYNRTNTSWILKEIDNLNDQNRYHHLRRRQYSWSCHMIVHDEDTRTPYFFSRVVGTPLCLK